MRIIQYWLAILCCSENAFSADFQFHGIYGRDDRKEYYQADLEHQILMDSVAAMMKKNAMSRTEKGNYLFQGPTLKVRMNLCEGEAFSLQPSASDCTGFLVASDLLATAGHCVSETSCAKIAWVFDYAVSNFYEPAPLEFTQEQVYFCKRVIAREETDYDEDYALIQLDRAVPGRAPLLMSYRAPTRNTPVFAVGYPSGLPQKFADNAIVRSNASRYFTTNLDVFGGNSGSPVFNADTFEVEGLVIRGGDDYVRRGSCKIAKVCEEKGCDGEEVSLIADIRKAMKNSGY